MHEAEHDRQGAQAVRDDEMLQINKKDAEEDRGEKAVEDSIIPATTRPKRVPGN